jgi:hypothetical protein
MTDVSAKALMTASVTEPICITVREFTRVFGIGTTTAYRLMDEGRLASTRVDGRRLIFFQSAKKLVEGEGETTSATDATTKARSGAQTKKRSRTPPPAKRKHEAASPT